MTTININKLRGKIVENGLSIGELAKIMGIDRATLYRKLSNNGESLLVREANAMVDVLHLSAEDAISIFFSQIVA